MANYSMRKKIISVFISCFILIGVNAQTSGNQSFKLKLSAFKQNNKVYLRWSFANAQQWQLANEKGYIIERANKDSMVFRKLNIAPLKPITELQALKYGKNSNTYKAFSVLNTKFDKAKATPIEDQNTVYAFYLLLSSLEESIASLTGSGYIDSSINATGKYTYRVTVANTDLTTQSAGITSVESNTSMPPIPFIEAKFGDKNVKLSWDIKPVVNDFIAVVVERSTDSVNYTSITDPPLITSLTQADNKDADTSRKMMYHADSKVNNSVKYFYRIKGINVFGISSNPSNIIAGTCEPDFTLAPKIIDVDTLASKFIVTWSFADTLKPFVKKYEVWVSETGNDSTFTKLSELLAPKKVKGKLQLAFSYKPMETNYFIIKAINNKTNIAVKSAPYLYMLKDSIPPSIPISVKSSIDITGLVKLVWMSNTEPDLAGYRIYKSLNNNSKSFTAINSEPFKQNNFEEKVKLNQLNRTVYYKITAVDNKYNESALSNAVLVLRPDIIPPASVVIKSLALSNDKKFIQIIWSKSYSKDVNEYAIYRKNYEDSLATDWKEIAKVFNTDTSYSDITVKSDLSYSYAIKTIDSSGLQSDFSNISTYIAAKVTAKVKTITNLNAYISREKKYIELNWSLFNTDVSEILIYRVENRNEAQVNLLATLPSSKKIFDDENIKGNTTYTYYLKAVFKDGGMSDFFKIDVDF